MNDQGLEGSVKTAMAETEDDVASTHVEDGSQSKTGGDGEADDAGVGLSAHQGASDDSDGDDDILRAKQEIDAKIQAAAREKKRLSDQIRLQKKMRLLEQLEREYRRLWDELTSVTEESDAGHTGGTVGSVLRAPKGGERQHSSGLHRKSAKSERNRKTTKVKAKTESVDVQPKRTVTIGDLRDNLTLNTEANRALNILGVSVTDLVEPSHSSESEGPRTRVKHTTKCRDRCKKTNHCCSKQTHGRTGKSKSRGLGSDSDSDTDAEAKVRWP